MTITILCGGSGTRLWPLSRELLPKQFVKLVDNTSLFQKTLLRNASLGNKICIITNESHYFLAQDEINALDSTPRNLPQNSQHKSTKPNQYSYILESVAKNTAPALLFSALSADANEIILALPSDHIIKGDEDYIRAVLQAQNLAQRGKIVLFGIKPTSPHTGYGYIKDNGGTLEFTEKPNIQRAKAYIQSGDYFWNSGMFCFKASVLINEFKTHQPKLFEACYRAFKNAKKDKEFIRLNPADMDSVEDISIDYAIMEKSRNLALLKAEFEWNDVGSFDSLRDEFPKDSDNNAHNGELIALDSKNNFILSNKLTATIGVSDLIVIDTMDSLLISKEGESQKIKEVVKILKDTDSELCKIHTTAYRPWGSYTVLLEGLGYKIKQIIVKPKKRLSLQKHFHRNEHWIVVSGSAIVRVESNEFVLKSNESTYIPMGSIHRLSNPGKIDLVMIEVQVGEYLGEDDIVRLEDDYARG